MGDETNERQAVPLPGETSASSVEPLPRYRIITADLRCTPVKPGSTSRLSLIRPFPLRLRKRTGIGRATVVLKEVQHRQEKAATWIASWQAIGSPLERPESILAPYGAADVKSQGVRLVPE